MKHERIMELLKEAVSATTARRNSICCELSEATAALDADGVYEIDTPEAGLHLVVNDLFFELEKNHPDLFPTFFPVFSMLCGNREKGGIICDIRWDLVD
ncbi:MAG: hypothetical protein WCT26_04105 [Candidatus Buchananbacteria bacterium]|jgi:hypothetical protein